MDFFEEKTKERKEKDKFIFYYKKSILISRKVLSIVFSSLGATFIAVGLILMFTLDYMLEAFLPFIVIGPIFIIAAIILFFALGHINYDAAYERYKKRTKNGIISYNTQEMNLRIIMLEKRVNELEEEIDILKGNKTL